MQVSFQLLFYMQNTLKVDESYKAKHLKLKNTQRLSHHFNSFLYFLCIVYSL